MLSKKDNYEGKALVLDDNDRSFLTVVKSLWWQKTVIETYQDIIKALNNIQLKKTRAI